MLKVYTLQNTVSLEVTKAMHGQAKAYQKIKLAWL